MIVATFVLIPTLSSWRKFDTSPQSLRSLDARTHRIKSLLSSSTHRFNQLLSTTNSLWLSSLLQVSRFWSRSFVAVAAAAFMRFYPSSSPCLLMACRRWCMTSDPIMILLYSLVCICQSSSSLSSHTPLVFFFFVLIIIYYHSRCPCWRVRRQRRSSWRPPCRHEGTSSRQLRGTSWRVCYCQLSRN